MINQHSLSWRQKETKETSSNRQNILGFPTNFNNNDNDEDKLKLASQDKDILVFERVCSCRGEGAIELDYLSRRQQMKDSLHNLRVFAFERVQERKGEGRINGRGIIVRYEAFESNMHKEFVNHLKRNRMWREKELLSIMWSVLKGLQELHEKDLIHGDIRLSSIVYTTTHEIKLADQFCVHVTNLAAPTFLKKDLPILRITAAILPPEINIASKKQDCLTVFNEKDRFKLLSKHSDLWALGIVLLEMSLLQNVRTELQSQTQKDPKNPFSSLIKTKIQQVKALYSSKSRLSSLLSILLNPNPEKRTLAYDFIAESSFLTDSFSDSAQGKYIEESKQNDKEDSSLDNPLLAINDEISSICSISPDTHMIGLPLGNGNNIKTFEMVDIPPLSPRSTHLDEENNENIDISNRQLNIKLTLPPKKPLIKLQPSSTGIKLSKEKRKSINKLQESSMAIRSSLQKLSELEQRCENVLSRSVRKREEIERSRPKMTPILESKLTKGDDNQKPDQYEREYIERTQFEMIPIPEFRLSKGDDYQKPESRVVQRISMEPTKNRLTDRSSSFNCNGEYIIPMQISQKSEIQPTINTTKNSAEMNENQEQQYNSLHDNRKISTHVMQHSDYFSHTNENQQSRISTDMTSSQQKTAPQMIDSMISMNESVNGVSLLSFLTRLCAQRNQSILTSPNSFSHSQGEVGIIQNSMDLNQKQLELKENLRLSAHYGSLSLSHLLKYIQQTTSYVADTNTNLTKSREFSQEQEQHNLRILNALFEIDQPHSRHPAQNQSNLNSYPSIHLLDNVRRL